MHTFRLTNNVIDGVIHDVSMGRDLGVLNFYLQHWREWQLLLLILLLGTRLSHIPSSFDSE